MDAAGLAIDTGSFSSHSSPSPVPAVKGAKGLSPTGALRASPTLFTAPVTPKSKHRVLKELTGSVEPAPTPFRSSSPSSSYDEPTPESAELSQKRAAVRLQAQSHQVQEQEEEKKQQQQESHGAQAPPPASAPTRIRSVVPNPSSPMAAGRSAKGFATPSTESPSRRLRARAARAKGVAPVITKRPLSAGSCRRPFGDDGMKPPVSALVRKSFVHVPVYEASSPVVRRQAFGEPSGTMSPASSSILTESFYSPTERGISHSRSAVFPRATRDIHRPSTADSGDVAQSTSGGVGTVPVMSRLRRVPSFVVAQSTRECEALRIRAKDHAADRHGPADYQVDLAGTRPKSANTVIGTAPRVLGPATPLSPGPCFVPASSLRRNRRPIIGTAPRRIGGAERSDAGGPSPLSYRTEGTASAHIKRSPSATFGAAPRKFGLVKGTATPGPYGSRASTFVTGNGRRTPSFGFSTAKRF